MMKPTDTLYIPIQFRDALALAGNENELGFVLLGTQGGANEDARERIAKQIKHAICIANAAEDMGEVAERVSLRAQRSAAAKKASKKKRRNGGRIPSVRAKRISR